MALRKEYLSFAPDRFLCSQKDEVPVTFSRSCGSVRCLNSLASSKSYYDAFEE